MRQAMPPPLSAIDTLGDGLRLMLGEGLDHLNSHLAAARRGEMEAIHQMRVALRRLRSTIRLFRRHLDPVAADGFDDALRRLGQALGAARDWDVFVLETIPAIGEAAPHDSAALETLSGPAREARDMAHDTLRTVLDAPLTNAVLNDLAIWASAPVAFFPDGEAGKSLAEHAPRMLDRLDRRVSRRGRHLSHLDDEERHDLRKALKALRYGIQMLEMLYGTAQAKRYRKALGRLQEDLGALNDAIAAVELAQHLPELPGRAVVSAWSKGKKRDALEALPASWRRFKIMKRFW